MGNYAMRAGGRPRGGSQAYEDRNARNREAIKGLPITTRIFAEDDPDDDEGHDNPAFAGAAVVGPELAGVLADVEQFIPSRWSTRACCSSAAARGNHARRLRGRRLCAENSSGLPTPRSACHRR